MNSRPDLAGAQPGHRQFGTGPGRRAARRGGQFGTGPGRRAARRGGQFGTGAGRRAARRGGRGGWLAAAVLIIGALMDMIDLTIVNVALPTIRRDLHVSATSLEWVISGY